MTAYLIAAPLLWPLGFGHETERTGAMVAGAPGLARRPGMILLGLVAIFGRFERSGNRAEARA